MTKEAYLARQRIAAALEGAKQPDLSWLIAMTEEEFQEWAKQFVVGCGVDTPKTNKK